jgi:hypothetical protein
MYQYDIEIETVRNMSELRESRGRNWTGSFTDVDVVVKLVFHPLALATEQAEEWAYYVLSTDKSHTLHLSSNPRGPKQREAVEYLMDLVSPDREIVFSTFVPSWCASQSVLEDAPQVIQDFMATLPVRTLANA